MPNPWNLDDGLKLVRALQQECRRFGYHLALGGGVLNNGRSDKDIDLYFLPLDNSKFEPPNPSKLIDWLVKMWGEFEPIGIDYDPDEPTTAADEAYGPRDVDGLRELVQSSGLIGQITRADNPWWRSQSPQVGGNPMIIQDSILVDLPSTLSPTKPLRSGPYKYKLRFNRNGDRIDVFVL